MTTRMLLLPVNILLRQEFDIMITMFNKCNAIQELFEMVIAGMITIDDMWNAVQVMSA